MGRARLLTLPLLAACLDPLEGDGPFADDDFLEESFDDDDDLFDLTLDTHDLTVQGARFDAFEGRLVDVLVWPVGADAPVEVEQAIILGGRFAVVFRGVLTEGRAHEVAWSVDEDGDGVCDPGEAGWSVRLDAADADVVLLVDPSETPLDVCGAL